MQTGESIVNKVMEKREKNNTLKLNNEGMTLVEVLIVVAIIAIVSGIATFSFSAVSNTKLKQSATQMEDAFEEIRTKATSISADEWNLEITKKSEDEYEYVINKVIGTVDQNGVTNYETTQINRYQVSGEYEFSYLNVYTNKTYTLNNDETIKFVFSMNQGGIKSISVKGSALDGDATGNIGDEGQFIFKNNRATYRVKVYYVTGKCEMVVD